MEMRVKRWDMVPRGGFWKITHPETKTVLKGASFAALMSEVKEHHRINNIPIGLSLGEQVERWICEQSPDNCVFSAGGVPIRPPTLTKRDIYNGTLVLLKKKLGGAVNVDQAEADRRAAICSNCPANVMVRMPCGSTCADIEEMISKIIGSSKTQFDSKLNWCGICHCSLKAAVWVDLQVQCVGVEDDARAQFAKMKQAMGCWKECQ